MPATTAERRALPALGVLAAAVLAAVVLAAAVLVATGLAAVPAAAHAVLTGTQPERGATVAEPLEGVVLEFNEGVVFPQVQVTGPDGTRVEDGLPVERGRSVEQSLLALPQEGTYTVVFRVTSDDGHPVEGEFEFAYVGPTGDGGEDDPSAVDAGQPEQDRREQDRSGQDRSEQDRVDEVTLGAPALGVAAVVLLGFAGAAVFAARGRRSDDDRGGPDPADRAA